MKGRMKLSEGIVVKYSGLFVLKINGNVCHAEETK